MKKLNNFNDWTLTETDLQEDDHGNNILIFEDNMVVSQVVLSGQEKHITEKLFSLQNWTLTETDVLEGHHGNNILMLEANMVLASAAQELSQPTEHQVPTPTRQIVEVEEDTWQSIVQRRIESKTRRFSKGKSKPEPQASVNRFAPVSGHFFYPLMTKFDRKENTFDMLGEDSLVLGRLIYTLGVVMYSAINSPTVKQMATVLLEFLWVLRFHQDQSVRHSILFSLSMVLLSVPGHILLSQLQSEILEAKQWLEDVVQKDPDTESKKLALQCLVLLENIIKQEFTGEEPT